MSNPRFLLLGYYGRKNTGDDAMLLALLEQLHCWYPQAEFLVTAANPVWLSPGHIASSTSIVELSVKSLVHAIIKSDIVMLGGGTHFHDLNKNPRYFWVLMRFFFIFLFARILRKRCYLLGMGIGPIKTWWARFLTKCILQLANFVLVRDTRSYHTALSLGYEHARLGFDLSCLLVDSAPVLTKAAHKKVLGISILPAYEIYYHDPDSDLLLVNAVAAAAAIWLDKGLEYRVRLMEFKGRTKETDFGVTTELRRRLIRYEAQVKQLTHQGNPRDMLRMIAECDAMIAMRYHACLFSYLTGIPAIWIEYHPKNASLAEDILLPSKASIPLHSVAAEVLTGRMKDLLQSPESFLAHVGIANLRLRLAESLIYLHNELDVVLKTNLDDLL